MIIIVRPTSLRDTLKLKYDILSVYRSILAHADLPYFFDERSLQNATNFTFETTIGDIDLIGEVAGVGTYLEVEKSSDIFELYERNVRVLLIDALINAKRAAGRTKDLLVLPELEALREVLSDEEE